MTEIVAAANKPVSNIFLALVVINFFLNLAILVLTLMKSEPSIPPNIPRNRAP